MSSLLSDFVVTPEYRRFAEFCDACRRYRYIGLCYGAPGVGKTLSARHYANWEQIEAYRPHHRDCDVDLDVLLEGHTIFYTPKVANSPRQIDQDIRSGASGCVRSLWIGCTAKKSRCWSGPGTSTR